MNVLLVDDDRFVLASLMKGIHWEDLGFNGVFTAQNITDAKSIIENNPIDFLLSDIDMPNGNGLDLLTWIRDKHDEMPVIFLTNYADFYYAQKAIHLKTFHYFLKPIKFDKLTNIIKEVTAQLLQQNTQQSKNCDIFWYSFLHEEVFNMPDVNQYFTRQGLPYKDTDYFIPVMFDLFPHYLTADNQLCSHFATRVEQNSYIKITFEATFLEQLTPSDVFLEYDENCARYIAIFRQDTPELSPLFSMNCERFIETVSTQMQCNLNCFIGLPSHIDSFPFDMKKLCTMISNILDCNGKVLLLSQYEPAIGSYPACDVETLDIYLQTGQYSAFFDYCKQYIHRLSRSGSLHATSLNSFQIDVVQILYSFLRNKGILANKLFHDDTYHFFSKNAKNSIYDMKLYLQYIIYATQDYLEKTTSDKSIAKLMQDYVDQHYSEDISRSNLADVFYLDPDYASKLFKKETGISFKNYIINKRIEVAKNLLIATDLPINTVSDNVGYGNYSYFTRLFKKVTNMTPNEYRSTNIINV
ncbi:response regulator transcription factor [Anaerosporobacter sp.]|uniref:response regulator transcription factor n=1 Tax=Anaerosporobacter sp. TaxID=1872529 RepID=UPI00286F5E66|nr:response regulator [Anaerosporobacter sp.]